MCCFSKPIKLFFYGAGLHEFLGAPVTVFWAEGLELKSDGEEGPDEGEAKGLERGVMKEEAWNRIKPNLELRAGREGCTKGIFFELLDEEFEGISSLEVLKRKLAGKELGSLKAMVPVLEPGKSPTAEELDNIPIKLVLMSELHSSLGSVGEPSHKKRRESY